MTEQFWAQLKAIVRGAEGFSDTPYDDIKHKSGGYGHALPPDYNDSKLITTEQANEWLESDLKAAERAVMRLLGTHYDTLSEVRQGTLIEMCFQVGIGSLTGFKKMLKALRESNYDTVSHEILWNDPQCKKMTKLYQQTPKRAERYAAQMKVGQIERAA